MGCNVRKHTGTGELKERLNHGALLCIKRSNELFSLKTLLQDFPAIILHFKAAAAKKKNPKNERAKDLNPGESYDGWQKLKRF